MKTLLPVACLAFTLVVSCQSKQGAITSAEYVREIDQWHAERINILKGASGWLNIAGLHWLHEGINSFGTDAENELVFPAPLPFGKAGFFILNSGIVTQTLLPGVTVFSQGKAVGGTVTIYHPDSSAQPVLERESLRWFIIKREAKYGVRVRDLNSTNLSQFAGIERYPVNAQWKVTARWEATPGRTIPITNVLGQTTPQSAPGVLVFSLEGREYRLDALDEGSDELFVIFGDATNAKETYGAGRYLYVPLPDSSGRVTVDFNRSQNPPCAFTEFATCPLPPPQNVMDLAVPAGEKDYAHH
jgi:uncharacterized protein